MERIKEAAKVLKLYPKLQLGERRQIGLNAQGQPKYAIFPTGTHTIKITAEPTTTTINKMGVATKVFKLIVEENGQLYKWFVPLYNKDATEGHYLIERLQDVSIGETIAVEMKRAGARNYIEVIREGQTINTTSTNDEIEMEEENEDQGEVIE